MGGIANVATDYFKELFTTSSLIRDNEVAELIPRKITEEMNEHLTKEFHKEEILQAIHSKHPTLQDPSVCLLSFIKSIGIS